MQHSHNARNTRQEQRKRTGDLKQKRAGGRCGIAITGRMCGQCETGETPHKNKYRTTVAIMLLYL